MTDELKPCPFCSGRAERKPDPGVCGVPFGLVVDHRPECFLASVWRDDDDAINAAWNTRPTPEPAGDVEAMARAHCDFFGGEGWWDTGLIADTKPKAIDAMRAAIAATQSRPADHSDAVTNVRQAADFGGISSQADGEATCDRSPLTHDGFVCPNQDQEEGKKPHG